jgi:hypothetical protein
VTGAGQVTGTGQVTGAGQVTVIHGGQVTGAVVVPLPWLSRPEPLHRSSLQ